MKEKTGDSYGAPLEMVDARKLTHVKRAALRWLAAHPELAGLDVGFDAVGVAPGRLTRVRVVFDDG